MNRQLGHLPDLAERDPPARLDRQTPEVQVAQVLDRLLDVVLLADRDAARGSTKYSGGAWMDGLGGAEPAGPGQHQPTLRHLTSEQDAPYHSHI